MSGDKDDDVEKKKGDDGEKEKKDHDSQATVSDDDGPSEEWESHVSDDEMRGIIKSLAKEHDELDDVPRKNDPRCAKAKFIFLSYCEDSTTHGFNHIGAAHTMAVVLFWSATAPSL